MDTKKTEELFIKAYHYNWDEGLNSLKSILRNSNCDYGTALLLYWRARPEYSYQDGSLGEVADVNKEVYAFTIKLEEALLSGKYQEYIEFDPKDEFGCINESSLKRKIPATLREKSKGTIKGVDLISGKLGINAWYKAAEEGDIEKLESILKNGFDINTNNSGGTALHACVENYSLDNATKIKTIDFLLANGIKINKKSKYGYSAMHSLSFLCKDESLEVIKHLIAKGTNPHQVDVGTNLIFPACRVRNFCNLKYLLSIGVDPHIIGKYSLDTPLHSLFDYQAWKEKKCLPLLELLIEYKVDPRVLNSSGTSALDYALHDKPTEDLEQAIAVLKAYTETYRPTDINKLR